GAARGGSATVGAVRPDRAGRKGDWRGSPGRPLGGGAARAGGFGPGFAEAAQAVFAVGAPQARLEPVEPAADVLDDPLGAPRAQIPEAYIVGQTRAGVLLVAQHAAHGVIVSAAAEAALDRCGLRA